MNPIFVALLAILGISAVGTAVVMNAPTVSQPLGDSVGTNWYSHQLGGSGGALTDTGPSQDTVIRNNCHNSTAVYTC